MLRFLCCRCPPGFQKGDCAAVVLELLSRRCCVQPLVEELRCECTAVVSPPYLLCLVITLSLFHDVGWKTSLNGLICILVAFALSHFVFSLTSLSMYSSLLFCFSLIVFARSAAFLTQAENALDRSTTKTEGDAATYLGCFPLQVMPVRYDYTLYVDAAPMSLDVCSKVCAKVTQVYALFDGIMCTVHPSRAHSNIGRRRLQHALRWEKRRRVRRKGNSVCVRDPSVWSSHTSVPFQSCELRFLRLRYHLQKSGEIQTFPQSYRTSWSVSGHGCGKHR